MICAQGILIALVGAASHIKAAASGLRMCKMTDWIPDANISPYAATVEARVSLGALEVRNCVSIIRKWPNDTKSVPPVTRDIHGHIYYMKVIAKMQGTMKMQSVTEMTVTSTWKYCTYTYLGICREEEPFLQDGCAK